MALRINTSLHIVFRGESQLASNSLAWISGAECIVTCWSQLSTFLSPFWCAVDSDDELSIKANIGRLFDILCSKLSDDYSAGVQSRLRFISEQFSLLFALQRRYSSDMLMLAFRLLCVSRSGYGLVRDRALILPRISYLRKISSVFFCEW